MRALTILMTILLVVSVASAEKKLYVDPVPGGTRALDCSLVVPVECGDVITNSNIGLPNNVDFYSCSGWNEAGGEAIHQLTIPEGVCLEVTATISDMSADLDVFILGSCDENDCLAYGNTVAATSCLEPGTYYIVVDGYNGAESDFTLTVDCVDCACPVPACCPFENTVYIQSNRHDRKFIIAHETGHAIGDLGTGDNDFKIVDTRCTCYPGAETGRAQRRGGLGS